MAMYAIFGKSYSNSNYQRKHKEERTVEVLVTNYGVEEL